MTETRTIATTVVFTALVFATTMAFSISIPATKGYFDVGEIMVYTTALLFGPYVGAFAGGVGSAMSDAVLAPQYAPGTLAIKAAEGFLVGYLSTRVFKGLSLRSWKLASIALGGLVAVAVTYLGVTQLSGALQVFIGFSSGPNTTVGPQGFWSLTVPTLLWIVIGLAAFAIIVAAALTVDQVMGWTMLSILVGGSEMVAGYFLYEYVILAVGLGAAASEVPINVAQAVVGLLVSIPLARSVKRMMTRTLVAR